MTRAQKHIREVKLLGCIVCGGPADAHHILKSGRRIDDFHTIPLCHMHHRSGLKSQSCISRHPWKREFEKRYGSEMELLEQTRKLLAEAA